jgi:hypothetical protein
MGRDFAVNTGGSAEAPQIDPAVYDMRFDGTTDTTMTGGQWQKNPDGDPKIEWHFTLLDDDGAVLYDRGEPIQLSKVTGTSFNFDSRTTPGGLKMLKALHTPLEWASYEADHSVFPEEEQLVGRTVQGEVFVKENGWPAIGNVIGPRVRRTSRA